MQAKPRLAAIALAALLLSGCFTHQLLSETKTA